MNLNVMKVSLKNNNKVDSINFKNAVIQSIRSSTLPGYSKTIKDKRLQSGSGNDIFGDVVVDNYPNLERLVLNSNSLSNANSLKICNCEKLKNIKIEDSGNLNIYTLKNVKEVSIESINTKYV